MRLKDTQDGDLWFTSDGVQEIPIRVVPRKTESNWIGVHADGSSVTKLTGKVVDQAALHGLLRKLYDLGLSLLSTKRIELD